MVNIRNNVFDTWKTILLFIPLCLVFASPVCAVNITLQWAPNPEPNLAGYRVFHHEEGQAYDYANPSMEVKENSCDIGHLYKNKALYFVVRAFDTAGVESGDSDEVCLKAGATQSNQPPTAVISEESIEAVPGTRVTLDGSKSTDADDGIASYHWSQADGTPVTLSDYNSKTVTFIAPETDQYGSNLIFRLTITDFGGLQSTTDCHVNIASVNEPSTVILQANFDHNTDGFSYVDVPFGNNGKSAYADGERIASGGFIGGALQITIGGIDNASVLDMIGGWQQDFTLSSPTEVLLSFLCNLTQASGYEDDELSQVLVSVDHILYGVSPNDYVIQTRGNGNGGSSESTGWQRFEINLGILGAGDHTLFIGGYNSKKTYNDEVTEVLIDDVSLNSIANINQAPDADEGFNQTIAVAPQEATARLESGSVRANGDYITVHLANIYARPVVICSVQYNNNTAPVVVRVNNVTSMGFDMRLQNPSGGAVETDTVNYLVVERGTWDIDGVKIEAQTYISTVTDENNSWIGEAQNFEQRYTNPVVLGQVMSENDSGWSVFWCQGVNRTDPPSAMALRTGKTVGEDTDTNRPDETIGFIVFEAGHGMIGGVEFEASQGAVGIRGVDDSPPHKCDFNSAFSSAPEVVITTQAGMVGSNGGWAQSHGSPAATSTSLYLSIDEDQIGDSERSHISEQVGYVVFETPMVYP